jgi:hypothetical protein
MTYNFQTDNNKMKLLTEYESVTQKVSLLIESILQNAKQLPTCAPFVARKITKLPDFDQHLPAKCSVFSLLFGVEHYRYFELL